MLSFHLSDSVMKSLSKHEFSVLQYIYAHPEDVLSMSIQQLSSEVGYSATTVLRLCKKLGFSGYSELKYSLKDLLQSPAPPSSPPRHTQQYQKEILDNMEKELVATASFINHEHLLDIIHLIDSDRPMYLFSPGGITGIPVKYLQRLLFIMGRKQVFMLESTKLGEHVVKNLDSNCILFLISTSGAFAPTIRLARIAAINRVCIIAISPYETNTLSNLAQYNLRFFTTQRENKGAELTSRLPIFFLINTLFRCYVQYKEGISL